MRYYKLFQNLGVYYLSQIFKEYITFSKKLWSKIQYPNKLYIYYIVLKLPSREANISYYL